MKFLKALQFYENLKFKKKLNFKEIFFLNFYNYEIF